MRVIAIIHALLLTTGIITSIGCESLFDDYDADNIFVFTNGASISGNLGGRSGADQICQNRYNSDFSYMGMSHVRALINVSTDDEIRDMPKNYGVPVDVPIISHTGFEIAGDWEDLLDGSIKAALSDDSVDVFGTTGYSYFTGELNGNGTIDTSAYCSGWTTTTGNGRRGSADVTSAAWLSNTTTTCASGPMLLCIAW